jgi:hypothetical protein
MPSVAIILSVFMLFLCSCEPEYSPPARPVAGTITECEILKTYQPVKAVFLPLTEIQPSDETTGPDTITAYISLQDSAGLAVKAPAVFRLELYQFKPLSADPKGKRLHIWDDINLNAFNDNNRYWRDYLRAYEFSLLYNCPDCTKYVLEVTCMIPSDRRLPATITLDKK